MTSRVPPSKQQQPAAPPVAQRPRRSTRPVAQGDTPKAIKLGGAAAEPQAPQQSPEAQLWSGLDIDRSFEVGMQDAEERVAEQTHAEAEAANEVRDHHEEVAQTEEGHENFKDAVVKGWANFKAKLGSTDHKTDTGSQHTQPKQGDPATSQSKLPPVPAGLYAKLSAVGQQAMKPTAGSYSKLSVAGQAQLLQGALARVERPPDAFMLLKEAKEKGVLFVEDALTNEDHTEERDEPALAAAVEECIRLCFGVRGILRIGPGKNDLAEPIIVVVATQGFSDSSLGRVPSRVHRFATLIAIPFDLLPLKRERDPAT